MMIIKDILDRVICEDEKLILFVDSHQVKPERIEPTLTIKNFTITNYQNKLIIDLFTL